MTLPELTWAEWAITLSALSLLLTALGALARSLWRGRGISEGHLVEIAANAEPIHDPCAYCGHARGDHYRRADGSRGACLDGECDCFHYEAAPPGP
jgi:hypothetical protein